jgi:hypothetical protein
MCLFASRSDSNPRFSLIWGILLVKDWRRKIWIFLPLSVHLQLILILHKQWLPESVSRMFLDFLGNFIHRQHYYYVAKIPEAACLTPTRPYLPLDLSPSFLASSLSVVGIIFSRAGRTSPCCLSALSPSLITSASTSFSACPQSSSPAALCPPPSSPSRVFPWCPECQPLYSMPLLGSMAVAVPAISLVADLAPATSPRWISSGRRDAASYTSCGSLVLALALGYGTATAIEPLRVAPSTCST